MRVNYNLLIGDCFYEYLNNHEIAVHTIKNLPYFLASLRSILYDFILSFICSFHYIFQVHNS